MESIGQGLVALKWQYSQLWPLDAPSDANSQWIHERLETVRKEIFDALREHVDKRRLLHAEIEDLLEQIETLAWSLYSTTVENITDICMYPIHVSYPTRRKLREILDAMKSEMMETKRRVLHAISRIRDLSIELDEDVFVPFIGDDAKDWGPSIRDPIFHKLSYLEREHTRRLADYEALMDCLHVSYNILQPESIDAIDGALKKVFESKRGNKTYYDSGLFGVLSLSDKCLHILHQKSADLVDIREKRIQEKVHLESGLQKLWKALSIQEANRKPQCFIDTLDKNYLSVLRNEYEHLRSQYLSLLSAVINEYKPQLEVLWDKCLTPQDERQAFMNDMLGRFPTHTEARQQFVTAITRLSNLSTTHAFIVSLIEERNSQIQKMIEFEQTASDPKRLFQSSFRLLQEEKWRKTAWPKLVKIEDTLLKVILDVEKQEGKDFHYPQGVRYLEVLQMELADRMANELFFGFEPKAVASESHQQMQETLNTIMAVISPAISTAAQQVAWTPNPRELGLSPISELKKNSSPLSPKSQTGKQKAPQMSRSSSFSRPETPQRGLNATKYKRLSQDFANARTPSPSHSSASDSTTGRTRMRRVDASPSHASHEDANKKDGKDRITPTRVHRIRRA